MNRARCAGSGRARCVRFSFGPMEDGFVFVEISGTDREEVARQIVCALWKGKDIRLTAGRRESGFFATVHTLDDEPEPNATSATS